MYEKLYGGCLNTPKKTYNYDDVLRGMYEKLYGGFLNTPKKTYNYDDVLRGMDAVIESLAAPDYPHYDIVEYSTDVFSVDIAAPGFAKEDLTIMVEKGTMTVTGKPRVDGRPMVTYTHRGIPQRDFTLMFSLGEYVDVYGAEMRGGILSIKLKKTVPEAAKPKVISIQ